MNREAHIVKRVTVGLLFAASAVVYGGGDSDAGANAVGAPRFAAGAVDLS